MINKFRTFVLLSAVVISGLLGINSNVKASHDVVTFSSADYATEGGVDDLYTGPVEADLDNDGDIDIVMPNPDANSVSVYLNDGNGVFTSDSYSTGAGLYPFMVVVEDFNGDGYQDFVSINQNSDDFSVFLNDQDGTFTLMFAPRGSVYSAGDHPSYVVAGDFDQSGTMDLAIFAQNDVTVKVAFGNGDGFFPVAFTDTYSTVSPPYSGGLAIDVNNDSFLDLVTLSNEDEFAIVMINDQAAGFDNIAGYPLATSPYTIKSADLDGDGYQDLVVPNYADGVAEGSVSVLLNNGDGTYADKVDYTADVGTSSVVLVDVNDDNAIDMVASNDTSNTISVFLNNGDGTFAAGQSYDTGAIPFGSITTGDFNGDGYPDIVTPNIGDDNVSILINDGTGAFNDEFTADVGTAPFGTIVVDDLNGDGKLDMVVPNSGENNLTVLLNTTQVPEIQFEQNAASGLESVTNPTITVTLGAITDHDVSVDYAVTGGTATGGGVDYTLANGTATIIEGELSTTIPLVIVNDQEVEADETIEITLSSPDSAVLGDEDVFTYTILNNDPESSGTSGSVIKPQSELQPHPNGTLINHNGTIYLIKDGKRYGFRDPQEYASYGYRFSQAVPANNKDMELSLAAENNILKAMPGSLVLDTSDNRTVYMIGQNGTKRGFTTESAFYGLGYNYSNLFYINLSDYPTGAVINSASELHPEGSLLLDSNDNRTVWWLINGQLQGFESQAVFDTYGLSLSRVVPANNADMTLSQGPLVKLRDGTLVVDGGTHYIISDGQKLPFASLDALKRWGYDPSNLVAANVGHYSLGKILK